MTSADLRRERASRRELVGGRLVATWVPESSHGTSSTYANHACRCVPCTTANRARQFELRELRMATREWVDGRLVATRAAVHNRATYSNWGCRCDRCTTDWANASREKKRDDLAQSS